MLQKENVVPSAADRQLFLIAPLLIFAAIFTGYSVLPLHSGLAGAGINSGIYFILAIISLDVFGILIAGWSSNNKYSLLGATRAIAQMISYEVPVGLAVVSVIVISQTLDLQAISYQQGIFSESKIYLFGLASLGIDVTTVGGILSWNIIQAPFLIPVFVIFFIATLAESNRTPFDLPESESELIGGFHTEYPGFRWGIIMLSEYGMMLLVALLGSILFLGSWNTPLPNIGSVELANWTSGELGSWAAIFWGSFWLLSKAVVIVFFQMMARWSYPRLRIDQLMAFSWKYLTPAALVLLLLNSIWRLFMIVN
jgi:NADH-quinone oxidoreductase subunit H